MPSSGYRKNQKYNRHGSKNERDRRRVSQPEPPQVDPDSPVAQAFLQYKTQLDTKHDKHEALVKISRDVTIESKRIIFHLHRCIGADQEKILTEAEEMISSCINGLLYKMAQELQGCDPFLYTRAITAGLQEFIEAFTFFYYLKHQTLPRREAVQSRIIYTSNSINQKVILDGFGIEHKTPEDADASDKAADVSEKAADASEKDDTDTVADTAAEPAAESTSDEQSTCVPLSQSDFILGIADLTGELMRMSINSIGWGDMDTPRELRTVLQHLDMAFRSYCSTAGGEMGRKMLTLKQSVTKVENACYTVKLRGSEIPKHMLAGKLHNTASHEHTNLNTNDSDLYDI